MGLLEIKKYPDKALRKKSAPVETGDKDLQRLIDDMIETMQTTFGIGLAAPQVGVHKRLIVIDVSGRTEDDVELLVMINPELTEADDIGESEEGCLSLPEYVAHIKRAGRVKARGLDRN